MVEAFVKVSEASRLLLEKGLVPATGAEALGMVAHTLGVHRAFIFENRAPSFSTKGRFVADLRHAWAKPGIASPLANASLRTFAFRDFAPGWADMLEGGLAVACPTAEAPVMMRELLVQQGVHSSLLCPITPAREWWGFIGFEDCERARVWRPEEISILKSLARAVGASVRQAQMRASLNQVRSTLRGAVLQTAPSDS
ncbi:GAF domain-containing protein [Corallococcus sp. H22C18031201]|uniref:GAF domain-containing protein n=1 Tax=Citreicoccus inhibens TaxID=2849499 RepID=UPI000E70E080|nr:GAF domain-containing protein [Citreicoccus inhibens]MBU8899050.1 GAF domain-containing protein [Citreicoccus inhibens]RJS16529.1 GAF domain-containing protein [Corallococcus sp. H22C18031201]